MRLVCFGLDSDGYSSWADCSEWLLDCDYDVMRRDNSLELIVSFLGLWQIISIGAIRLAAEKPMQVSPTFEHRQTSWNELPNHGRGCHGEVTVFPVDFFDAVGNACSRT